MDVDERPPGRHVERRPQGPHDDARRPLKLDAAGRYALVQAAKRLAGLAGDAEVRAEAARLQAEARTSPTLAGALGVLGVGIVTERYASSLDASARSHYESTLHGVGCSGAFDSGAADVEGEQGEE